MHPYILSFFLTAILLFTVPVQAQPIAYEPFGTVAVYQPNHSVDRVILLCRDKTLTPEKAGRIAATLTDTFKALVLVIDTERYLTALNNLHTPCLTLDTPFFNLSQFAQQSLHVEDYHLPYLIGQGQGAALVYAVLAQAPVNTFAGALSLDGSLELPINKQLCPSPRLQTVPLRKQSGYALLPGEEPLRNPWRQRQGSRVSHGKQKQLKENQERQEANTADPRQTDFMATSQFTKDLEKLMQTQPEISTPPAVNSKVADLPLVTRPATGERHRPLVVLLSGQHGWSSLEEDMAELFQQQGMPVVGLNSLLYFWHKRNPEMAGQDLERIVASYLSIWQRDKVLLIGHEQGASTLPFMAGRLSALMEQHVGLLALINPQKTARFALHISKEQSSGYAPPQPVLPELSKLLATKTLCMYNQEHTDSLCPSLSKNSQYSLLIPFSKERTAKAHHQLARLILKQAGIKEQPPQKEIPPEEQGEE